MKNKYLLTLSTIIIVFVVCACSLKKNVMIDLTNYKIDEIKKYCKNNNLELFVNYKYSNDIKNGNLISQSIKKDTSIKKNSKLTVILSKGKIDYNKFKVNELGKIPIMMYHGIYEKAKSELYVGGNVDVSGYNRTVEYFKKDLEFYYNEGYRMIKLKDYIKGKIGVELGKSPIIITFDDGLENNIRVTGLDSKGDIIIDPNSAVGILENFKKRYPDYNITATFFINSELFNQPQYNEKIMKWLIDNNYDIGNHTYSHVDFTKIDSNKTMNEVGSMYQILEGIIPKKYINVVALPFGSPYNTNHSNFNYILNGSYNDFYYSTISTLRVGWEAEESPYSLKFNPLFLKRIRAYDNNGLDFDIEMNFKKLLNERFISDGDTSSIVIPINLKDKVLNNYNLKIITY